MPGTAKPTPAPSPRRRRPDSDTLPITDAERAAAIAEAKRAISDRLAEERKRQAAEAIAIDREALSEWGRRLSDLADRIPHPRTDAGREIASRLRVRLGIARNDLILAGLIGETK